MTLAHPMAVLPLRRLGLPMTAMVIGAMVPDVPVFLHWYDGYALSHRILGIFSIDLALALVAAVLWYLVVREAVVDMAPGPVRRWQIKTRRSVQVARAQAALACTPTMSLSLMRSNSPQTWPSQWRT